MSHGEVGEAVHQTEADPLGAELENTEQSSSAFKGTEFLATADGNTRRRDA